MSCHITPKSFITMPYEYCILVRDKIIFTTQKKKKQKRKNVDGRAIIYFKYIAVVHALT